LGVEWVLNSFANKLIVRSNFEAAYGEFTVWNIIRDGIELAMLFEAVTLSVTANLLSA